MLFGEHYHSLDSKNRIIIPTKLREELGSPFMLTKGLDNCVYAYPMEEWKKFQDKISVLPEGSKEARMFKRFFFSGATEVELDKQGRVLIPQSLIEYSGLHGEVVTIGMNNKLEIWSKERWTTYTNDDIDMDEIAENMAEFGI